MFFRKSKKNDSFLNRSSCFVIGYFLRKNKRMKCPTRSFPWPNSRDYRNDGSSTNCCPKDYIFWRAHRRSVTPLCTPVPVQIQGSFQCQSLHRVGWINRQLERLAAGYRRQLARTSRMRAAASFRAVPCIGRGASTSARKLPWKRGGCKGCSSIGLMKHGRSTS